jgi:hypothetical protein
MKTNGRTDVSQPHPNPTARSILTNPHNFVKDFLQIICMLQIVSSYSSAGGRKSKAGSDGEE